MPTAFNSRFTVLAVSVILQLVNVAFAGAQKPATQPVEFTNNMRILFQGDSITDGNRGRNADPNHVLGHGYCFILAAKYGAYQADLNLDFINRGVSGNTVHDLARRWQKDTLDLKPDVLSILIGVNDNSKGVSIEEYEKVYIKLIDDAKSANPNIRLVLCEPFGMAVGNKKENFEKWFATLKQRQEIVAKLGEKYSAPVVHFQKVFDEAVARAPAEHWIWDGVHPTYSGHQLMADEWERVVAAASKNEVKK